MDQINKLNAHVNFLLYVIIQRTLSALRVSSTCYSAVSEKAYSSRKPSFD
jgi:hypothetical protein